MPGAEVIMSADAMHSVATFAWLPLAAGIGDWTSVIIWAVVIGIGILNQLFGGDKKKPPQAGPRQPNGGGGNVAPGQKPLLDEVERFLQDARKATAQAHNRPAQQQRPQQQPPRQQKQQQKRKNQQQREQQQREQQARQQPQRLSQSERARLRPEVDELEEVRLGGGLSQQVQDHLSTSRFDERAGRLSHLQQTVDADIGGHVSSAFNHQVGSLTQTSVSGATTTNVGPEAPTVAGDIRGLLEHPNGLMFGVLMREILEPPTHRW